MGRRTGFEPATSGATIQCSTNCATVSIAQFSILGCSWQGTNPTFSRQCCTSSRAHVRAAMPNCMWFNAFCILPFVYYGAEDGIRTRVSTLARSYPCPDWKTSADYGHNACIATDVMMELAGSAGFEPATRLATHTRLPSGRIRPLSQLPNSYAVIADDDLGARTFCCLCRKPSMHAQRSQHADSMRCRTGVSDSVMS